MHRGINIADLNDNSLLVKSHAEILQLIREIEELEQHINQDDFEDFKVATDISKLQTIGEIPTEIPSEMSIDESVTPESVRVVSSKIGLLRRRRPPIKDISDKTRLQSFLHPEPIRNVFVLRLTEGGELQGFDLKKPQAPREKFNIRTVFKRKSAVEKSGSTQAPVKGLKGKLLGITSLFKKKGAAGEGSKAAGVVNKLKGIFSRK